MDGFGPLLPPGGLLELWKIVLPQFWGINTVHSISLTLNPPGPDMQKINASISLTGYPHFTFEMLIPKGYLAHVIRINPRTKVCVFSYRDGSYFFVSNKKDFSPNGRRWKKRHVISTRNISYGYVNV
ncbi:MAG: hypothetical protein IJ821_02415, partial [Lachnospiraceae bacterium]|nr:hypothetical protein [Lachnospiraceae bacterium]